MAENKIRLTYFDCRGRGEPIRLMLEAKNHPYTYHVPELQNWQTTEKAKFQEVTYSGQLPIIEIPKPNGEFETFSQSLAIARHVAKLTGLDGSKQGLNFQVDEITEIAHDLLVEIGKFFWDPKADKEATRKIVEGRVEKLDKYFAKKRSSPTTWVGNELTMGDIYMAFYLEQLPLTFPGLFTKETYPDLWLFYQHVFNSSGIKEYVTSDRRPKCYTIAWAAFAGKPEECVQWK